MKIPQKKLLRLNLHSEFELVRVLVFRKTKSPQAFSFNHARNVRRVLTVDKRLR